MTFTPAIVLFVAGFLTGKLLKGRKIKKLKKQISMLEDMNGITWLKKK